MSEISSPQPTGTPTWIDLGIPDLDVAMDFYRQLFGWQFQVGSAESGYYTTCTVRDRSVAALTKTGEEHSEFWWNVHFATDDCDGTVRRIVEAGGELVAEPMEIGDLGRMAIARDPVGGQFGLWQAGTFVGCQLVNEAGTLLRNDMVTPSPGPARDFYCAVFDFTLDGNDDLGGVDFTFLRRPDGHEIGGIVGQPEASTSAWGTLFQVADADAAVERARAAGGTAEDPYDMVYGRVARITDPFGATFDVGAPAVA